MKMTNAIALQNAIDTLSTVEQTETVIATIERLAHMHETLVERAKAIASSEKVKAANEKRKAETKAARDALMATVLPVIRSVIAAEDKTAEQIYEDCKANLPADFTVKKVQYILIHELADEVVKVDNGRNSKTYKKA